MTASGRLALYLILFLLLLGLPFIWMADYAGAQLSGMSMLLLTIVFAASSACIAWALFRLLDADAADGGTIAQILNDSQEKGHKRRERNRRR